MRVQMAAVARHAHAWVALVLGAGLATVCVASCAFGITPPDGYVRPICAALEVLDRTWDGDADPTDDMGARLRSLTGSATAWESGVRLIAALDAVAAALDDGDAAAARSLWEAVDGERADLMDSTQFRCPAAT